MVVPCSPSFRQEAIVFGDLKLQSAEGVADPNSGETEEDMEDDIGGGFENGAVF